MIEEKESGWRDRSRQPRFPFAMLLIAAGALLFLGNLGIISTHRIWAFWPVFIVVFGFTRMRRTRDAGGNLLGALAVGVGALALLRTTGFLHLRMSDPSLLVAMIFIGFGLAMLLRGVDKNEGGLPLLFERFRPLNADAANALNDVAILGAVKRKLDTSDFRGGHALSLFGNVEIDLRRARIAEPGQVIMVDSTAIFGAVKLRVPDSWRVNVQGISIFGNYEDKTVPPNLGGGAPTLVIGGYAVFGSIEIED